MRDLTPQAQAPHPRVALVRSACTPAKRPRSIALGSLVNAVRSRSFDLNLLVALDALLTERSVTRAARHCGVSQPAMSIALRKIRHYFEDPILSANGRELEPTALARALVIPVHDTLVLLREILSMHQEADSGSLGARVPFEASQVDRSR